MNHHLSLALALIVVALAAGPGASGAAAADRPHCRVDPFQGATSTEGAVAQLRVPNNGRACVIVNYGLPAEHEHPADSGRITKQAAHGTAAFVAPDARYTPLPGYVGDDEFEYEAWARGKLDRQYRLKVRARVTVTAP
ncbi:MAG: Ig-like domain-containing protein [Caldimonas sp.]